MKWQPAYNKAKYKGVRKRKENTKGYDGMFDHDYVSSIQSFTSTAF